MIGQRIGSYQIVRLLGQGGMSAVYEGVHDQIGRRVAIKVLHERLQEQPDLVARFIQEARAANQIQHPAIVAIHEYGQLPGGSAYLVMEYLEGETLERRLGRLGGRLPQAIAVSLARQVAGALAAAHARGIVHRDIKSPNIMIVPDPEMPGGERVKVLDFGIAKVADEGGGLRTRTGVLMGTPHYMSPEQCRGAGRVDDRTDVYSLGVLLFEMLSGRLPFQADGPGELIAAHLGRPPPPLSEVAPWAAPELCALVDAMLRKAPAERPAMAEVVATLDRLRTGLTAPPAEVVGDTAAVLPSQQPVAAPLGAMPSAPRGTPSQPSDLVASSTPPPAAVPPPGSLASAPPPATPGSGAGQTLSGRAPRPVVWLAAGLGLGMLAALAALLGHGRGRPPSAPSTPGPPPAVATAPAPASSPEVTPGSREPAPAKPDSPRRPSSRRSRQPVRSSADVDPETDPATAPRAEEPARLGRDLLGQQLARLAAQVAPGQRQVGGLQAGHGRKGQEQHRYVYLTAGRCYTFVSVGAPPMEALYAYLWDPRGRRVATEKSSGRQPVVHHCAAMTGHHHFLVKAAGGDGEYRSALFVR